MARRIREDMAAVGDGGDLTPQLQEDYSLMVSSTKPTHSLARLWVSGIIPSAADVYVIRNLVYADRILNCNRTDQGNKQVLERSRNLQNEQIERQRLQEAVEVACIGLKRKSIAHRAEVAAVFQQTGCCKRGYEMVTFMINVPSLSCLSLQ